MDVVRRLVEVNGLLWVNNQIPMRHLLILVLLTPLFACQTDPAPAAAPDETRVSYARKVVEIDPGRAATEAAALRSAAAVEVDPALQLTLWAADSLVTDPIALSIAPDGRVFYTRAERMKNSEFDIRGHMDWTEETMALQTVEERRAFLRKTFAAGTEQSEKHLKDLNKDGVKDWRDLAVQEESVWAVSDRNGDGVADRSQRFLSDFSTEVTDVANGIEFFDGDVYVTAAPDFWRTGDDDGDGTADRLEALATGFGVHIGFSGHGLSGATVGPQGRLWWGIGDIGSDVTDQEGKRWRNPNQGVIVRCDPDGSNFEVFARGLRNTHEFAFDDYGNLITVDNDGDHAGERERLLYVIDGSDTGWRINWQYGKYTDPKNNTYKVWMDEQMHTPRHPEQAAYFLPPIQNYVNGPTGLVYNPGTGLGPDWAGHFFVAEFRGGPGNSPLHAFTMADDGAGFKLGTTKEIVRGLLPTGVDFGPDGALYFGDWINGWGAKGKGKIWKLDVAGAAAGATDVERRGTAELIVQDFSIMSPTELTTYLQHPDQRIRRKAQFALAKAEDGQEALRKIAVTPGNELARVHAIWGLAQRVRYGTTSGEVLLPLLAATDAENIAQAARMIGDQRIPGGEARLIELLAHPAPRARFFATEALGRLAEKTAVLPIVQMLRENDDEDVWLRQAGMIALGRIGEAETVAGLASDPSRAVRTAAVVALRRMESPLVQRFLADRDPYVVAEAARAIHDDFSIAEAMPALAALLEAESLPNEVTLRRAISANLRLGGDRNATRLIDFARRPDAPVAMRADALLAVSHWAEPSVFDRVTGRFRGKVTNDTQRGVAKFFGTRADELMTDASPVVRQAALAASAELKTGNLELILNILRTDASPATRAAAIATLGKRGRNDLDESLLIALRDNSSLVRSRALSLLPDSNIPVVKTVDLYREVIDHGSTEEAQTALAGLGGTVAPEATALLRQYFARLQNDDFPAALRLDLVEAMENTADAALAADLKAYETEIAGQDSLGYWAYALSGGDRERGVTQFYNNTAGQCTRCHAAFEYGGNVGPGLEGVGGRLSPQAILTSLVYPSAMLAPGYETMLLELTDGTAHSGILVERTAAALTLQTGKTETKTFALADVASQETLPSSMPSVVGRMTRREVRDLVSWLAHLRGE